MSRSLGLALALAVTLAGCSDDVTKSGDPQLDFSVCPSQICDEAEARLASSREFVAGTGAVFPGFVFPLEFSGYDPLGLRAAVAAECATCGTLLWWLTPTDDAWVAVSATEYQLSSNIFVAPIDDLTGEITRVAMTSVSVEARWDSESVASAQRLGYDVNPMYIEFVNWRVTV